MRMVNILALESVNTVFNKSWADMVGGLLIGWEVSEVEE